MTNSFIPRRWQEMLVRDYQTKGKKNYFAEGCTSSGKTGMATYLYKSLKKAFGWDFFTVVVPSEHLMKQYAQDAFNLFGLNFYYSGTDKRLGRIPTLNELINKGYEGLVISYQWLSYGENAKILKQSIEVSPANKVFLVLDEVHHVSNELSYGQACETAFPDELVSHRLMTSGTPFRSDGKKILGGWIDYQYDETRDRYTYKPDFCYKLVDALNDGIIPHFSFVTLAGEFTYRYGEAVYEGKTFESENEEELSKILNTAIYVDGEWVKTAIEWAHERMKRDRKNGFPECATYVRVPFVETAYKIQKRIYEITGEESLVVASKSDPSFSSHNFKQTKDPSQLIEDFAAETGHSATSWIIGIAMLGEGISIKRLKYRIHATNVCARLSFEQDLGRLLRKFPEEKPQPVETLIPAHPKLRDYALEIMNEVSEYFVRELQQQSENIASESNQSESSNNSTSSLFQPISSTGEFDSHIVDGKEFFDEYVFVAEWAMIHHSLGQSWGKTSAHLAEFFAQNLAIFQVIKSEYESKITNQDQTILISEQNCPLGFESHYSTLLADKKTEYASNKAHKKAKRLAFLLLSKNSEETTIGEQIAKIHTIAKQQNNIPFQEFLDYQDWEKIYLWLSDKVTQAELQQIRSTEDL